MINAFIQSLLAHLDKICILFASNPNVACATLLTGVTPHSAEFFSYFSTQTYLIATQRDETF